MENLLDMILSPGVNVVGATFKLLLSLLLGSVIGLERRRKGQIAGMRTFSLICMGATLAMLVSIYIPQEYMGLKNGDPGRIAAQVISGIGFLGAGAIIQMKGSVKGLTTAAGIWMTAAIGLAIGAGMYMISLLAVLFILFILAFAERYEQTLFKAGESKIIRVKAHGIVEDLEPYRKVFKDFNIHIVDEFIRYDYGGEHTIINFIILAKGQPNFPLFFKKLHENEEIRSITLTNEVNN